MTAFYSCDFRTTECKEIGEWRIGKYRFVKSDCLGYAGPHFYPISVYVGNKKLADNATQVDSCVFSWQSNTESYLTFNFCNQTIQELKEHKTLLNISSIDSVIMFSNELKQAKWLTNKQTEKFVKDWNNSNSRGYYPEEDFDSAFYIFPGYQYRLSVYSKGTIRPFYCYNYLILDSSNWKYEMSKVGDVKYFQNYWK